MMNWFRSNNSVLERKFNGRSAMITGAGGGMGREMAILMAASGIKHLTLCDMNMEGLKETVSLVEKQGRGTKVTWKKVDVCSEPQMQEWVADYKRDHCDVLNFMVCNAGIAGGKGFLDTSKELWDKVFEVDFHGLINTVRQWIPLVVSVPSTDPAHIVNLSSLNGYFSCISPSEPNNPYIAAKFAVRGFTESLMVELAASHPHVVVTCVHPGHVGTDILASSKAADKQSDEAAKTARSRVSKLLSVAGMGLSEDASDSDLRKQAGLLFKKYAPVTAVEAANIILTGVAWDMTRIRVGADATFLDLWVRACPRFVYTKLFFFCFYGPFVAFRHLYVYLMWRKPLAGLSLFALFIAGLYMRFFN